MSKVCFTETNPTAQQSASLPCVDTLYLHVSFLICIQDERALSASLDPCISDIFSTLLPYTLHSDDWTQEAEGRMREKTTFLWFIKWIIFEELLKSFHNCIILLFIFLKKICFGTGVSIENIICSFLIFIISMKEKFEYLFEENHHTCLALGSLYNPWWPEIASCVHFRSSGITGMHVLPCQFFKMLDVKPRAFFMLGNHSTTEPHTRPSNVHFKNKKNLGLQLYSSFPKEILFWSI